MAGEKMTEDFNKWWDSEGIAEDNSYRKDSPAYWAWEGWQAAVKAEREECAKIVEQAGIDGYGTLAAAVLVRERSKP
jgi:hypothetical protein